MNQINIFWHRRDLRCEDNVGLYYALDDDLPVLPVFVFDTNILEGLEDKRDARVTFIYDELMKLDKAYRRRQSGLNVFYGSPESAFEELCSRYSIRGVYTNRDYEPYAKERDDRVEGLLSRKGVGFYSFKDQVIFEKGEIFNEQGEPYKVFTPYKNKWLERLKKSRLECIGSEGKLEMLLKSELAGMPSLKEMGFERSSVEVPSLEVKDDVLEAYAFQRDFPAIAGTSRLGVHLRFGTISIRKAVIRAREKSDVWLSELIWREFYMMILAHFPKVVDQSFKAKYDRVPWINDQSQFEQWCNGQTGYPIVDAGMRELNATGYMHNRVRMIVASFLTKHLLIDWRWGEHYFAAKLLDYELSSNNGGWQWAAGTGTDAQPYFRVFNPYSQQEKFDKSFEYIRRWVPEFETDQYPEPIVSHKNARIRAIETFKQAIF